MPRPALVLAALLTPSLASAEPRYLHLDGAETSAGPAVIAGERLVDGERVMIGGRTAYRAPPGVWLDLAAQRGDLLLVASGDGGNACPALYFWLHAEDPGFRASATFGTCSDLIEVTHDAETVMVAMPDGVTSGLRAYVYDGHRVIERSLGLPDAPLGPDADAEAWIGRYPSDLIGARDWQPRLAAFMAKGDIRRAQAMMERITPFEVEGDWVVGTGYDALDPETAVVAIHHVTGELVVAWRIGEEDVALFREGGSAMPPSVLALVDVR